MDYLDYEGLRRYHNLSKNEFVSKETDKGLSSNDYTTTEKNKLAGIATGATAVTESTVSGWGFTKNTGTLTSGDLWNYVKLVTVANNTENDFNSFGNLTLTGRGDPTTGSSVINSPWASDNLPAGGFGCFTYLWSEYGKQIAFEYGSNRIHIRGKNYTNGVGAAWESWLSIALTGEAQPASDVYSWAKASSKPSYSYSEISGTPSSLPANGGNAATVGGHTVGTDVPSDADFTNTWRPLGTGATDACAGNDSRLSDSRNAADVYSWAKASTKPSYTLDEVTDGSTRALSNYLPLTGGTMSGAVTATAFKQTYTNPTTAASYTISPNVAYYLNAVNQNTTFTFGSPESGIENEYKFQFDIGNTAYSITMPSGIIWQNAPTFEANKHYEISVKYDPVGQRYFGLCSSFNLT